MNKLMVRMTLADILLVEALISQYMREKNIKDINKVDEKVIQERYDEIIKLETWKNPSDEPSIKCPQCRMISYNENDIKFKFCGKCHQWHEDMEFRPLDE